MSHKIILFGKPGAGKDTQAKVLVERFGLEHVLGGALLRKEIAEKTPLGNKVAPYVERGEFVPKGIVTGLVQTRIFTDDVQRSGYVVTSYPRSRESFEKYLAFDTPTLVAILDVSDEEATRRLLLRKRGDDYEEAIKRRLEEFRKNDEPLFVWLENQEKLHVVRVDGAQIPEKVAGCIIKLL